MKNFLKKNKKEAGQILLAVLLACVAILIKTENEWLKTFLFLPSYLTVSYRVIKKALRNIAHGDVFDENFLMLAASLGALILHENTEAVAVIVFYRIGEMFEHFAVAKSKADIAALMDICPETARVLRDGKEELVSPEDVVAGEELIVCPGEKIPVDGVVIGGTSSVDTAAMTGESVSVDVSEGQNVLGGCINLSGVLHIKSTKNYEDNAVVKILELIEESASKKAKAENFITKFARIYTPAVCAAALFVAVIPPIFFGNWSIWIHRALTSLVVSCPCALVISVPLGFFCGIGGASKKGILVKGSNCMEALAKTKTFVFDKTGTLTKGKFSVVKVFAADGDEKNVLRLASMAERRSGHPVADAIRKAYGKDDTDTSCDVEEIAGLGVKYTDKSVILAGNRKLMEHENVEIPEKVIEEVSESYGTQIFVAENGVFVGCIVISDTIKENSAETIKAIKDSGARIVMLTGDNETAANDIASRLGIENVKSSLLPADKAEEVERLIKNSDGKTAFVGDGINDAPVLMLSDVGIAMGAIGSDAAIEAADIVIMNDDVHKVCDIFGICKKTMGIVRQNIVFTLIIKVAVLALGFAGICGMWEAVFADVGVSFIAIINSMRAMK